MKKRRKKLTIRKKKFIILNTVLVVFLLLGMGYSVLSTNLNFTGNIQLKEYMEPTLYNVLKQTANEGTYAKEYTGSHQDSMAGVGSEKIYHWYANNNSQANQILEKNNVIFANHCWQMIRTTDTGGIKMIYNGEVSDNKCLDTREKHVGYKEEVRQGLNSNYWYGTEYTYNSVDKTFSISGDTEQKTSNASNHQDLIGKYTCKGTNVNDTCTKLYFINSFYNSTIANAFQIDTTSIYNQFGTIGYNNNGAYSPAYAGYMFNTVYKERSKDMAFRENILSKSSINMSYWYADNAIWGIPTSNNYNLVNLYQVSDTSEYQNLKGKYSLLKSTNTSTNNVAYYIVSVENNLMYYIMLQYGNNIDYYNDTYTYGDSYTDNGDGTYTINNPITINRFDWIDNYNNIGPHTYICKNAVNDTCNELWYTHSITNTTIDYIKVSNNYKYANGYTYENGVYKLNDNSISFWNIKNNSNLTSLNNKHYTCWNLSGECSTVSFIEHISNESYLYGDPSLTYIEIEGGKNIQDALNEMLYTDDVNYFDSTIKIALEEWYEHFLLDYDDYIDDAIFCNDRSLSESAGWDENGSMISKSLKFKEFNLTTDLGCTNLTDRFSISNPRARIKYKVGLMTAPEMNLLNNETLRKSEGWYWLLTPSYHNTYQWIYGINSSGVFDRSPGGNTTSAGVRPAIVLKPEVNFSTGTGSKNDPYIVDTN